MSLGSEYVSITMEIDTGDGRIVVKNTPEFQIYDKVQFEIAKYLKDIYPYIIEIAYLHMVWDALDKRQTSVFELLSPYYANIGNGFPTEPYTPKSLRLNFKYRKEREILDRDEVPMWETMSESEREALLIKSVKTPSQKISDWLKSEREKDKNLEKSEKQSMTPLWWVVGFFVIVANIVATEGESLYLYVPIALIWGFLYWIVSIDRECWYKLSLFFSKIKNFFKNPFTIIFVVVSACLLVGALGKPFDGYYMLLRVITCATCVYSAVKFKTEWTKWIFGILAVVYNPVLPVHLGDKDLWAIINLATIVYMWVAIFKESKQQKTKNNA